MPNKPKFLRPTAERAVERLVAHHEAHGELPAAVVAAEAQRAGYSVRHLRRLVKRHLAGEPMWTPPAFEVNDLVVTAVFLACGCLDRARRYLDRTGHDVPSPSTFRRRVLAKLGTAQLAYAKHGSVGFRDAQAYLSTQTPHRLHTVELDHTELPIWVVPRGYATAVKPWMTAVVDAKTSYVLSWVITFGRPTASEVRAALMSAMTGRLAPDGVTVVGGKPMRALWDRGLEFLSNLITESCLRLDVLPVALPAYSPHLKPHVERLWRFLKEDLLPFLPGYNEGPADVRGQRAIASAALGEDEFLLKLADWVDWYVTEHRVNGEATPLEAWRSDPHPLEHVEPEQLWIDMLLAKDRCKVSKNGIRFDRIDFTAPEVTGLVGRSVEIRYLPHDRTFIEVFLDGAHVCTAHPKDDLTAEQAQAVIVRRKEVRLQARSRFTTANRQRKQNATGPVYALEIDRQGNRIVVSDLDDLLEGGEELLAELVEATDADQGRLF